LDISTNVPSGPNFWINPDFSLPVYLVDETNLTGYIWTSLTAKAGGKQVYCAYFYFENDKSVLVWGSITVNFKVCEDLTPEIKPYRTTDLTHALPLAWTYDISPYVTDINLHQDKNSLLFDQLVSP